jgi:hypothetical protein
VTRRKFPPTLTPLIGFVDESFTNRTQTLWLGPVCAQATVAVVALAEEGVVVAIDSVGVQVVVAWDSSRSPG